MTVVENTTAEVLRGVESRVPSFRLALGCSVRGILACAHRGHCKYGLRRSVRHLPLQCGHRAPNRRQPEPRVRADHLFTGSILSSRRRAERGRTGYHSSELSSHDVLPDVSVYPADYSRCNEEVFVAVNMVSNGLAAADSLTIVYLLEFARRI